jgi:hypothetical protein
MTAKLNNLEHAVGALATALERVADAAERKGGRDGNRAPRA